MQGEDQPDGKRGEAGGQAIDSRPSRDLKVQRPERRLRHPSEQDVQGALVMPFFLAQIPSGYGESIYRTALMFFRKR